jgi:hypothetical protein
MKLNILYVTERTYKCAFIGSSYKYIRMVCLPSFLCGDLFCLINPFLKFPQGMRYWYDAVATGNPELTECYEISSPLSSIWL